MRIAPYVFVCECILYVWRAYERMRIILFGRIYIVCSYVATEVYRHLFIFLSFFFFLFSLYICMWGTGRVSKIFLFWFQSSMLSKNALITHLCRYAKCTHNWKMDDTIISLALFVRIFFFFLFFVAFFLLFGSVHWVLHTTGWLLL